MCVDRYYHVSSTHDTIGKTFHVKEIVKKKKKKKKIIDVIKSSLSFQ